MAFQNRTKSVKKQPVPRRPVLGMIKASLASPSRVKRTRVRSGLSTGPTGPGEASGG